MQVQFWFTTILVKELRGGTLWLVDNLPIRTSNWNNWYKLSYRYILRPAFIGSFRHFEHILGKIIKINFAYFRRNKYWNIEYKYVHQFAISDMVRWRETKIYHWWDYNIKIFVIDWNTGIWIYLWRGDITQLISSQLLIGFCHFNIFNNNNCH